MNTIIRLINKCLFPRLRLMQHNFVFWTCDNTMSEAVTPHQIWLAFAYFVRKTMFAETAL